MEYSAFGNTKINVSKIGLGLAALGRPGYINLGHGEDLQHQFEINHMEANTREVLETAYQSGIRYFDVARSYGKGEEFLGNWLKQRVNDNKLVVGSKWGYTYTADWKIETDQHEIKEHSLEVLKKQWPESKEHLERYLAIYHIHSATLESGVLDNLKVLAQLWELKQEGIIIGLSLSGEQQSKTLQKAFTISRGGQLLFQSVQATWNILEQSASPVLAEASERGFGIIIKEALANGRLSQRNHNPYFYKKKMQLEVMAEKYQVGVDAISLAYVLKQPWVNTVLSGAATKAHLIANLQSLDISLEEEDLNILQGMAEIPADYWATRSGLAWN